MRSPVLVGLAVLAVLASGCGDGGAGATDPGVISVFATEPENPLVPGNTTETAGARVLDALFTGLVAYDPRTAQPRNAVAESITTTDSQVFTITLRPGWTFHDGTPVTARSFADAWNHTAYAPHGQQGASAFAQVAGFDRVHPADPDGDGPQPAPPPSARELSGVEVLDERTLRVTLTAPFSVFPARLGYAAFFPLPASFFADPRAFEAAPVGNGPFRFVSRRPGVEIRVARYEAHAGPLPNVAGVEFRVYASSEAAYRDVVAGNLDFTDTVPPSALPGRLFERDLPGRSVSQTYLGVQMLAFPLYDPRYADPGLRRAISMAIDRAAVDEQIFSGTRPPADGLVAPRVPGRVDGQCGALCTHRPDEARRLFEASGFTGPVELTSNVDNANQEWMQAVCTTITNALGRECRFVPVPTFGAYRSAINARAMTAIYRSSWQADYPSIENFLNPLYRTGAVANEARYSNPAVDDLLARADAAPSAEAGHALYQEAERLVVADMPVIPLYFQSVQAGWSPRLGGVVVDAMQADLDLTSVTVS
ncbi:MAG: peptide ABC transporter substrate-binding protein [Pseudonocardia sp.]